MKLRLGFVTNSSSTTHIMMWKGDKDRLKELLEAHQNRFHLRYVDWDDTMIEVTPEKVSEAILSKMSEAQKTSDYIQRQKQIIQLLQRVMEEHPDIYEAHVRDATDKIRRAGEFDWILEVGFGDNHGDFAGGDLGVVMDYEGRRIYIVDADRGFYYTTEQSR